MQETEKFQELTGGLDYSMLVVTTCHGQRRSGCLVGFATQCSIDPPRFMVCLSKANHTFNTAVDAEVVVVHALGADQLELARLFGEVTTDDLGGTGDKFSRCSWRPGPGGVPVLLDCPTWFAGRILDRFDLGDHVGFWLDPIEVSVGPDTAPLLFSAVKHLTPGHRA